MIDKSQIESLKVLPNSSQHPSELETSVNWGLDKETVKKHTQILYKEILELQEKMYAEKKHSLLIVLQAMDAAGKDSTIRKLTTHLNVQGARVQSFGKPSKIELAHDFLWRIHQVAPAKGEIVLFNRSHYEDVLVVKVHGWCDAERLEKRYQHINNFEDMIADNGTKTIKIMLNVSPEYQLSRFKSRLDNQGKNWKFNPGDLDERKLWADYMAAFKDVFAKCSTQAAPWYIVPAEQRWFRDYVIALIIRDELINIAPNYPKPDYDASVFRSDSIE